MQSSPNQATRPSVFLRTLRWWTVDRWFMLSRAIIALAQLSIFVLTPLSRLTAQVGGVTREEHCTGSLRAWNIVCSGLPAEAIQAVIVVCLLLVISGLVPWVTAPLHLYIAISTATGLTHIDGGESAAVVALVWISILCLFDRRWNGWAFYAPTRVVVGDAPFWIGIPQAAAIALKVQCSVIYLHSATAKFGTEAWIDGSAIYYITRMEMFGVSGNLAPLVLAITSIPAGSFFITYGVIASEILIAVLIWLPGRGRLIAVGISLALHASIIVLLGIGSFGLIMVGVVLAAAVAYETVANPRNSKTDHAPNTAATDRHQLSQSSASAGGATAIPR